MRTELPIRIFRIVGLLLAALAGLFLLLLASAGNLLATPKASEASLLLQVQQLTQGLPYEQILRTWSSIGGTFPGVLWSRFYGFNILSLRLWVLVGWLFELYLLYQIGKNCLDTRFLILILLFIALCGSQALFYQSHFFSGLLAFIAVYWAWHYLVNWYRKGQKNKKHLAACGLFTALTFWFTPGLGFWMTLAFGIFGLLHCLLHEREEKNLTYRELSNREVLKRWGREWCIPWAGMLLLTHGAVLLLLFASGLGEPLLHAMFSRLAEANPEPFGYYTTFHSELRFLLEHQPGPFWLRGILALHLLLIGVLPVMGLLGVGYQLPGRFLYRLLRLEDESLLLLWIAALVLISSTMNHSSSLHIISNGALVFLLGGYALQRWTQHNRSKRRFALALGSLFCVSILLARMAHAVLLLQQGCELHRLLLSGINS